MLHSFVQCKIDLVLTYEYDDGTFLSERGVDVVVRDLGDM